MAVVGVVGGTLLSLDPLDGRAGPLPVSPLSEIVGLSADGPVRIRDVVGAPVVLDPSGGLAPGPPTPGRLRYRAEGLQDIGRSLLLDGQPGGPALPGQCPHDLPVLRAQLGVGLQPAVAALLMLT